MSKPLVTAHIQKMLDDLVELTRKLNVERSYQAASLTMGAVVAVDAVKSEMESILPEAEWDWDPMPPED